MAEDVGERLAPRSPLQELFVGLARLRRQLTLKLHVEQRAGTVVARTREQKLGFEACGIDARLGQYAGPMRKRLTDCQ